jgi:hypothetical protein
MAGNDVDKESKSVKEAQDAAKSASSNLKKGLSLLKKANASAKSTKKELSDEDDSE